MKAQYCSLCGRDFRYDWFHTGDGGELVRFRDYEPMPEGCVGRPQGLEWFCRDHAPAALSLVTQDSATALVVLRDRFGSSPPDVEPTLMPDPSLWVTEIGPNRARVFALIHQAINRPAAEVLAMMHSVPFQLARGWPQSFETLRAACANAGAVVEVRYDSPSPTSLD